MICNSQEILTLVCEAIVCIFLQIGTFYHSEIGISFKNVCFNYFFAHYMQFSTQSYKADKKLKKKIIIKAETLRQTFY